MRAVFLCSLLLLSSCMPRIPQEVLDANWCRDMAAAKAKATGTGRANLAAAMIRHDCAAKLAAERQPAMALPSYSAVRPARRTAL